MRALALLCINQYTKCEVTSFASYKDMIGGKIKNTGTGHASDMTLTTPRLVDPPTPKVVNSGLHLSCLLFSLFLLRV